MIIRNNFIDSNTYGVVTEKTTSANLGTGSGDKGLNTITNSGTYCIWNRATNCTTTVQAYGNWFGSCTMGLPPTCWSGSVNVGTAECSAPASWGGPAGVEPVPGGPPVRLLAIRPNPMGATAAIRFQVTVPRSVTIDVFDVAGRFVRNVVRGEYREGDYEVAWDGASDDGSTVVDGLYFVRIAGGNEVVQTSKLMVVR